MIFPVRTLLLLFASGAALGLTLDACQSHATFADLVIRGGTIITLDDTSPEVEALAVQGGKIMALGTEAEIVTLIGPSTKIIDLKGATAIPGFIEGHGHFLGLGEMKMGLELMATSSWDEIVQLVREAAETARPGEWIIGRGWHQEKWTTVPKPNVEGFPLHDALSEVSPENPVLLTHASGHAVIANKMAMDLAGITPTTANPDGGEILHTAKGEPIGVFRETAEDLVRAARIRALEARTEQEVDADRRKAVTLATRECLSRGITTFQDAGSSFEEVEFFKKLADEGSLDIRLWVMIRDSLFKQRQQLSSHRIIGAGDNHLTVRAIKWTMDGALGARGAWFLNPYSDLSTSTGLNTAPMDSVTESAELAIKHGFQMCIHAIGDRANRETLDLYEHTFARHPERSDLRWRIEHAQHLNPADIPRFAHLGVIAAMQGIHCTSDAPYVLARLGSQRAEEGAYVWHSLLQSGATIVNGTDAPVEDVDPIQCFTASVTRKLKDGSTFYPDERMTRREALRSYTLDAAYGAFEEDIKGSLQVGKVADITILSDNLLTVADDVLPSVRVLATILGGYVVYERPGAEDSGR